MESILDEFYIYPNHRSWKEEFNKRIIKIWSFDIEYEKAITKEE